VEPIIQISGLSKFFDGVPAVEGLDLSVASGEIFGLVGPDGAGKTTTLRMLAGLIDPSGGSAVVAGCDVAESVQSLKDEIGYMAQRFGLYLDLTVEENMFFCADLFGVDPADFESLSRRLLEMTRMSPFRKRKARKLSGGMKQKLALMCALLHEPRVLFLDEPTNGVDPVSRRDFWVILYELVKGGMTVVVSTAYLDEAVRCNRVALLNRGRLIFCDSPGRLSGALEEQCYEVRCRELRAARALLERQPGVLSAEPSGSALHVFCSPRRSPTDSLKQVLNDAGFGPATVGLVEPSVEDLFIALVKKEAREAA
jgi:ABC-2 type transport system ATP-binding protein